MFIKNARVTNVVAYVFETLESTEKADLSLNVAWAT